MSKNKMVCARHFSDVHVKRHIEQNGGEGECSYCDDYQVFMTINELAGYLESHIEYAYQDPYSLGLPYDSEEVYYEDRFPGVDVYSTQELLEQFTPQPETEINFNDELFVDLSNSFKEAYWVVKDLAWSDGTDKYMLTIWGRFKEQIKHESRYFFHSPKTKRGYGAPLKQPFEILYTIREAFEELKFVKVYPQYHLVALRVRQHDQGIVFNSPDQMCSPPPEWAKANRMSPSGISMFYGALDLTTCAQEVVDETWKDSEITSARFRNNKKLKLIDFTKTQIVPSLFDDSKRHLRITAKFLRMFLKDMSVPIRPDDSDHIDYVPTQVVAEFLKHELGVDGIVYSSVKNPGGKCVALFFGNDDFDEIDPSGDGSRSPDELRGLKPMSMLKGSIQIEKVKSSESHIKGGTA